LAHGANAPVKNVVLVHGASQRLQLVKGFPLLQARASMSRPVGTPLTSFADDLAATKRAIAAEDGPVILVGTHMVAWVILRPGNDPK